MKRGEQRIQRGSSVQYDVPSLVAAAHELKSPLVLVRQLALALEDATLSESQRAVLLEQITLTSERALRLTSDLTRSMRLDDALFQLEPINPVELCAQVAQELGPLYRAHNRRIVAKNYRHSLLLVANRDLLRRILLNFSDNALHYSTKGGAVVLSINSLDQGKTIRLGVRDFGPALPIDIWRTLRSKLNTSPQTVHARPQSSGLGLYIASQFASQMHGSIGAIRHRDGATFYVDMRASEQMSLL
ncbi:MAG: putative Histidine kinase [Candidatus Saccharibacteria bacterium]|nr:putative Histidine kinase [Candidatus Saccharibacteria bacterium]